MKKSLFYLLAFTITFSLSLSLTNKTFAAENVPTTEQNQEDGGLPDEAFTDEELPEGSLPDEVTKSPYPDELPGDGFPDNDPKDQKEDEKNDSSQAEEKEEAYVLQDTIVEMGIAELQKLLAEHKNKLILLHFFSTNNTESKKAAATIKEFRKEFDKDKMHIIGISLSKDHEAIKVFLNNFTINYPIYVAKEELLQYFGVKTLPHNAVYNVKGAITVNTAKKVSKKQMKGTFELILEGKDQKMKKKEAPNPQTAKKNENIETKK